MNNNDKDQIPTKEELQDRLYDEQMRRNKRTILLSNIAIIIGLISIAVSCIKRYCM